MKKIKFFYYLIALLSLIYPYKIYSQNEPEEGPYLVLDSQMDAGFFALFCQVLGILQQYDEGHYAGIEVKLGGNIYVDPRLGNNWWNYFFEPIKMGNKTASIKKFTKKKDLLGLFSRGCHSPREKSYELIKKYVILKPRIRNEVKRIIARDFADYYVIGIHHRGTDKKLETRVVAYEKTVFTLNWIIQCGLTDEQRANLKLFIATDDQKFIDYMSSLYPDQLIYNDFARSNDDTPVHYGHFHTSNYLKGKEALIDCLMLSKCNALIYPGSSTLSIVATKMNPTMPTYPLSGYD